MAPRERPAIALRLVRAVLATPSTDGRSQTHPVKRGMPLLQLRVLLLAGATLVPAVQLWGGLGIPVVLGSLLVVMVLAVKLGGRTNTLALRRTAEAGLPVFYGFAAGHAFGGEVRVLPTGVILCKRRSTDARLSIPWDAIEAVEVRRMGALGPAGLASFLYRDGSRVTLEVDDGARFAQAVREFGAGVEVKPTGWVSHDDGRP